MALNMGMAQLGAMIAILRRSFPPILTIDQIYEGIRIARQLDIEERVRREGEGKKEFRTGQCTVAAAGTPVQLTSESIQVPYGKRVTVISKPNNTGAIYFANSEVECIAGKYFDGLDPALAHSFDISNVNLIWLDAETSGDGASWYVEQ